MKVLRFPSASNKNQDKGGHHACIRVKSGNLSMPKILLFVFQKKNTTFVMIKS
jgi:hypothetical protein